MSSYSHSFIKLNHTPSRQPVHKFKQCGKCGEMRPPEGGVDLNSSKWYCATCWAARTSKKVKTK